MNIEGNVSPGGGLTGSHVPLPTAPRPIGSRQRRTGFDWPKSAGPDLDAVARIAAKQPAPKPKRAAKPATTGRQLVADATTGRPRADLDEKAIVEAYEAGLGLKTIARQHHVHHLTIRQRLVLLGVELRPSGGQNGARVDVASANRLRAQGLSYSAIARALGCSDRAVRNHLSDAKRSW